jgi:hypothetical protein
VPVNYEPPIAESWVFVQPRYMTSRAISHYALPIGGLGVAFFGATNVYRPIYRRGVVYNYGIPRDRVVKIIRRPIYVQKVYRVDNWKGGRFDKNDRNKGIKIYAPNFNKDGRNRGPKKFVDNPRDFKPRATLHDTFKGDVPKGWGKSAKGLTPIAKEDPDGFKKKHGRIDGHGQDFGGRGKDKDRDLDNDKDQAKGTQPPPIQKVIRNQDDGENGKLGATDGQGDHDGRGKDKSKDKGKGQASKDFDRDGKQRRKGDGDAPPPPPAPPPVLKGVTGEPTNGKVGATEGRSDRDGRDNKGKDKGKPKTFGDPDGSGGPGGSDQFKQGKRDDDDGGGAGKKQKNFGDQGGPGPNQFKQGSGQGQGGERAQGQGGGGGGGDKKKEKCQKNPDHPSCQN